MNATPVIRIRPQAALDRSRSRAAQPREESRRSFRRAEAARYRPKEAARAQATTTFHRLWERCAVPGGVAIFWAWFAAANWPALVKSFEQGVAVIFGS
jgi:hypothetical protein